MGTFAQNAALKVFGAEGAPGDMATVHIRWGDKWKEAPLHSIKQYVAAIDKIEAQCKLPSNLTIFLMTEDPAVPPAFQRAMRPQWPLRLYTPAVGTGPLDRNETTRVFHKVQDDAQRTGGSQGLHALTSLILSLESRFFVIASQCNWSRLLRELWESRVRYQVKKSFCQNII